jgi:hypothetical protein
MTKFHFHHACIHAACMRLCSCLLPGAALCYACAMARVGDRLRDAIALSRARWCEVVR